MAEIDSLWKTNFQKLSPYWEQMWGIAGDKITILPLVGPGGGVTVGLPGSTSFTTRTRTTTAGGLEAVFTWSEPPEDFDVPFDPSNPDHWQGIVPMVTFNGTNEQADSPDAAWWSTTLDAFSWGAWVDFSKSGADATSSTILAKYAETGNLREWLFGTNASDKLRIEIYDEDSTGNHRVASVSDAALSSLKPVFLVATYDGTATPTSGGIILYVDGAAVAATETDQANFVSSRDTNSVVSLGFFESSGESGFFDGVMAGGPFGPFVAQSELTAFQIQRMYHLGREAMGLI
jgi:hypothetical protein